MGRVEVIIATDLAKPSDPAYYCVLCVKFFMSFSEFDGHRARGECRPNEHDK